MKVVKEPKDCPFGGIEVCFFCAKPTRYWHLKTNNPVCKECSKSHKVSELKNWRVGKG